MRLMNLQASKGQLKKAYQTVNRQGVAITCGGWLVVTLV
jgi:hypothetical protein